MTDKERIASLFQKHLAEQASAAETAELFALIGKSGDQEYLKNSITALYAADQSADDVAAPKEIDWETMFACATASPLPQKQGGSVVQLFRTRKWAVAAVLLIIAGAAWWMIAQRQQSTSLKPDQIAVQQEILPGKQGAVLTLSDGRTIVLDSVSSGLIATEGSAKVIRNADGTIVYNTTASENGKELFNTMQTPKGRQYQLTLPDGSKVWLNAASSITYPVAFNGNARRIRLSGEAYFEVVTDKQKPFFVEMQNRSLVQVLGTSFNVSAYENETAIRTTLLGGVVKVSNASDKSLVLKPGQQAVIADGSELVTLAAKPDLSKIMAWKNGLFNFEGAGVAEVMNQIERWYNVDVIYEGAVPQKEFVGEMNRQLPLSGVLKGLSGTGIRFRLEGRKLIVLQ
ncbi:DUF4974 domain-containing protein [Pseudoflavitalea sp. G-6-1-2]|uniref:FecR family protein n=1 Tax=Pseudoflavitalea sp. G-6-1-2 TaxID=2728841 RepID=UPI00146D4E36|nr:FecR family protein [Pseudoflavitalea sp. G-6-1-2]NML21345.1 DUF4974 domain-containing protein [Pseudoflavitalea sp. G-6-1-2]